MAKKFHNTDKGPMPCVAKPGGCTVGAPGEVVEHFESKDDARKAYELSMEAELFPTGTSLKEMRTADLVKLVKFTDDEKVMREVIRRDSARGIASLAKNPNATPDVLVEAYNYTDTPSTRRALTDNKNFPAEEMSPNDFISALSRKSNEYITGVSKANAEDEVNRLLNRDNVTDEIYIKFDQMASANPWLKKYVRNAHLNPMLSNPTNTINKSRLWDLSRGNGGNPYVTEQIMKSGRFGDEHIAAMSAKQIPSFYVSRTDNSHHLDKFADLAISMKDSGDGFESAMARETAVRIAENPNTLQSTRVKILESELADHTLFRNPDVDKSIKDVIAARNPELAREIKLQKMGENFPNGLKAELVVEEPETYQSWKNRGFYSTYAKLDPVKVKELGLDKDDIASLMGTTGNNGSTSWDEETGIFKSEHDTTD